MPILNEIYNAIRYNNFQLCEKYLKKLKKHALKTTDEFLLLECGVDNYLRGYHRSLNFLEESGRSLAIIKLLIKKFALLINEEQFAKLWSFLDNAEQRPQTELIHILLSKRSLSLFSKKYLMLQNCFWHVLNAVEPGCITVFYILEQNYRISLEHKIKKEKNLYVSVQPFLITLMLKNLVKSLNSISLPINTMELKGEDNYIILMMQQMVMLCYLSQTNPLNLQYFSHATKIQNLCKREIIIRNDDPLEKEFKKFYQLIGELFTEKLFFKSFLYQFLSILHEISEKLIAIKCTEKMPDKADILKIYEIHAYVELIAKKVNLNLDKQDINEFKNNIVEILGDNYWKLKFKLLEELVEKELQKIVNKIYTFDGAFHDVLFTMNDQSSSQGEVVLLNEKNSYYKKLN